MGFYLGISVNIESCTIFLEESASKSTVTLFSNVTALAIVFNCVCVTRNWIGPCTCPAIELFYNWAVSTGPG